jgi:hypothetical protein
MPYKPVRQLAAEKARGNKPANPSQLGDPIDLKAETSDGPDPVESEITGRETEIDLPRSALEGDTAGAGAEKVHVVGIGEGAGPVGGVIAARKKGGSKL